MVSGVRFGRDMRGSGIGARVLHRGRKITIRVDDALEFRTNSVPGDRLENILSARKGDKSGVLQDRAEDLLSQLNFTSTVFYPNHVMPCLIEKASAVEELDQWHAMATAKIGGLKRKIGRPTSNVTRETYSEFKWEAWSNIIDEATTPDQLGSLIDQWCESEGIQT
ncbi:MAG: hypothetical protein HQ596_04190 [Candidatus Saganbacteria bacterium]|nr:hypothetical protein [Candidatus Saganbacteria bacterium]